MLLRHLQEERDVEGCADPVAIARTIEASIHERFPFGAPDKQYEANARKLVFSMKQNQQLRVSLLLGETRPESVVLMSKDELATGEQLQERQRALAADMMSRDLDWVKKNRDAVFRANGLDPTAGGEFTCKRCKGTKTHHYSMQTRSSDEPMTVFVTCLTCNNRWRS
jgi:transcription elongation factor S-II